MDSLTLAWIVQRDSKLNPSLHTHQRHTSQDLDQLLVMRSGSSSEGRYTNQRNTCWGLANQKVWWYFRMVWNALSMSMKFYGSNSSTFILVPFLIFDSSKMGFPLEENRWNQKSNTIFNSHKSWQICAVQTK